ncbi:maltose acetyltransferase domain-containing protein [Nocardioides aurantiacus]|uniref:Maltose O-acetyltransferase n=1 Tax=Nocardioides aurantiacus TaxID=86796 RepID=A0A3N2CSW7_9ACTN|nr:DapH/DapD/GlmU-related protein [Nocardioides aurantiacus]ROR90334.1 maltose O-acetyltransferase [Nocardioides aurantiacus]
MPAETLGSPRTMHDRMLAGEPYAVDRDLTTRADRAADLAATYAATPASARDTRRSLLEDLLGQVGTDVEVRGPLRVGLGEQLRLGDRVVVAGGLVVEDAAPVTVGDDVRIGHDVRLLTVTLPLDAGQRRDGWRVARPVTIGPDVWLGDGVTVLPGVTIGAGTVVGAGSVVTRDLPAGVLAVGNPAAVIRQLVAG